MAAKAPAEDVLCEALDYLAKLGCNLRLRSESIKTKKVRRDKPNVLALHKAANKVLLICELSKKSIVNVEAGVRKIIQELDTAQKSSFNSGRSKNEGDEKEIRYFYFQYKSRKIRMRKEISLKHYTSAKVVVKSIPKAMIDKYPVYYDCKLYRLRKKEPAMSPIDEPAYKNKDDIEQLAIGYSNICDVNEEGDGSFVPVVPKSVRKIIENENITSMSSASNISTLNLNEKLYGDNLKSLKKDSVEDTHNSGGKILIGRSNSEGSGKTETVSKQRTLTTKSNDSNEVSNSGMNYSGDDGKTQQTSEPRTSSADNAENLSKAKSSEKSEKCKKILTDKTTSDSGKSQKISTSKHSSVSLDKKWRNSEEEDSDSDSLAQTNKRSNKDHFSKKLKKVNVIKDSSDEDQLQSEKNKIKKNDANTEATIYHNDEEKEFNQAPISKKMKLDNAVDKTHTTVGIIIDSDSSEIIDKDITDKEQCNDNEKKPLIKCVSLTKLLKPNILKKEQVSKHEGSLITKCINNESRNRYSANLVQKDDTEQEYWTQKRKEVALFKSKKFSIKILSLPKLSESYLQKLSLKKITCNGKVVCESSIYAKKKISDESLSEPLNNRNGGSKSCGNSEIIDSTTALLTDPNSKSSSKSDSENFHLYFSDSEGVIDRNDERIDNEMVKKSLLNDSDDSKDSETKNNKCDELLNKNKEKPINDKGSHLTKMRNEQENEESQSKSHRVGEESQKEKQNENSEDILNKCVSMRKDNEKTPEKVLQESETNEKKSSLLIGSSNDEEIKTPLSQRKKIYHLTEKNKQIRERMHAKKMLLTYSSSSDTEDEKLKNVLKEIKDSLLNGSDDEHLSKTHEPKSKASDSSSEDNNSNNKNNTSNESDNDKISKHRRKKHHKRSETESEDDSDSPKSRKKVRSKKS